MTNRYADLLREELKRTELKFGEHDMEGGKLFVLSFPRKRIESVNVSAMVRPSGVISLTSIVIGIPRRKRQAMHDLIHRLNRKARFIKFFLYSGDLIAEQEYICPEKYGDADTAHYLLRSMVLFDQSLNRHMPEILTFLLRDDEEDEMDVSFSPRLMAELMKQINRQADSAEPAEREEE